MSEAKRVIVTGATGLIGKRLCARLTDKGYAVVVFSRNAERARNTLPGMAEYVNWTPEVPGDCGQALEGAYGVVHLAGAPIFGKRWDAAYKAQIRDSRITSTRLLVDAMEAMQTRPTVFVCGSAVGYYGDTGNNEVNESSAPGDDFLAQVCVAWEQEASRAETLGIRTVLLRTGIVLDAKEGALPQLVVPFRLFVGGPILPGTQWLPWIHIDDEVGLILLALEDARVSGPLNGTAPAPQTNYDFTRTLGKVVGTPSWLPVPGFSIKLLLGELADRLVEGQRAIPQKAQELGYQFEYPSAEQALRDLIK